MTEKPQEDSPPPPHAACRSAGLALATIGCLNLIAGLALAVYVAVVGISRTRSTSADADLSDPVLYVVWISLVALLGLMGVGFLRLRRDVVQGLPRRIAAARALSLINLTLVLIEGAGIVFGMIFDPPKKADLPLTLVACAVETLFIAVLAITIRSLNRARRSPQIAAKPHPRNARNAHP
jgi:hypothetical protein